MAAAAAEPSEDDGSDDPDSEIVMLISMNGHRGADGVSAHTRTPAGRSTVNLKRPLHRSSVDIELYQSSNGHIGSNMLIRPTSATTIEPHGWRIVECQSRAGGISPPFHNVQCYGVSRRAELDIDHDDTPPPPSRPCPPPPPMPPMPPMKRRRRSNPHHSNGVARGSAEDRVVVVG